MSDLVHPEIYRLAIERYGGDAQVTQAIGGMGELTAALVRMQQPKRHEDRRALKNDVTEEMADAFIMLAQLRMIYNDDELFWMFVNAKTERLAERLGV